MIKRRSRIVSFRLAPEEYDSLRNLSVSNGARSVSEFTRSAAFQTAPEGTADTAKLDSMLASLNDLVEALDRRIEPIARLVRAFGNLQPNRFDAVFPDVGHLVNLFGELGGFGNVDFVGNLRRLGTRHGLRRTDSVRRADGL